MSAETWMNLSKISFGISAVLFVVTVVLFFRLKIPSVISDLTGFAASKQIKIMKQEKTSEDGNKRLPFFFNQGKSADKKRTKQLERIGLESSKKITPANTNELMPDEKHDKIYDNKSTENGTTILTDNSTESTTVLEKEVGILENSGQNSSSSTVQFNVDTDIIITHSNEKID